MQGSITTPGSIALAQAQAQAQVPAKAPLAGQVSTIVTTSTTTTVAKTITITRPTGVSFKKDVPVSFVSLCPSQRGRCCSGPRTQRQNLFSFVYYRFSNCDPYFWFKTCSLFKYGQHFCREKTFFIIKLPNCFEVKLKCLLEAVIIKTITETFLLVTCNET